MELNASESNKLDKLRDGVIRKFKRFGITGNNFDLYWQDRDGDHIVITENEDLSLSIRDFGGQSFEILACLHSTTGDEG